jgi:hypothetical protein
MLTGHSLFEIIGKTPAEVCKEPLTEGNSLKDMIRAFYQAQNFDVELILYTKKENFFRAKVKGQGKVSGYFAMVENIDSRKETEQILNIT